MNRTLLTTMGLAIHILSWLACLQVAQMFPMQGESDPALDDFRMRLAKKHTLNPFKESLLSSLGFYENPKGSANQRKKAVDSTFIRFGRSSLTDEQELENLPSPLSSNNPNFSDKPTDENILNPANSMEDRVHQEVINSLSNLNVSPLNPEDCRVNSRRDLVRVLLTNRNCLLKKTKRENVNDTFIRFGKREAPNSPIRSEDIVNPAKNTVKFFAR